MAKSNDYQVGGEHYRNMDIQPWDAIVSWRLGFLDGNVIRYIARWRHKNGIEDLRKAQHTLTKLIEVVEAQTAVKADAAKMAKQVSGPPKPPTTGVMKPKQVSMKADVDAAEKLATMIGEIKPDK